MNYTGMQAVLGEAEWKDCYRCAVTFIYTLRTKGRISFAASISGEAANASRTMK